MAGSGVSAGEGRSFRWPEDSRNEDDYADARRALDDGQLEMRKPGEDEWQHWPYSGGVGFIYPPGCYRRRKA